jgi:hypothetical protein
VQKEHLYIHDYFSIQTEMQWAKCGMIFIFQNAEEGKNIMDVITFWQKHNHNKEITGSNYQILVPEQCFWQNYQSHKNSKLLTACFGIRKYHNWQYIEKRNGIEIWIVSCKKAYWCSYEPLQDVGACTENHNWTKGWDLNKLQLLGYTWMETTAGN